MRSSILWALTVITLIFATWKLCGLIKWSWWLITMPLWAIPSFIAGTIAIFFVGLGLYHLIFWVMEKFYTYKNEI